MFTIPKSLKSMTRVANHSPSRYAINAIRVEPIPSAPVGYPAGLAVATDGKRLLACRVDGDGDADTSHAALIGQADWAAVCAAAGKAKDGAALSCNGSVVASAGAATIACEKIGEESSRWPEWRRVLPTDGLRHVMTLDKKLLAELLASMPGDDPVDFYVAVGKSVSCGRPLVMANRQAVAVLMPVSPDKDRAGDPAATIKAVIG